MPAEVGWLLQDRVIFQFYSGEVNKESVAQSCQYTAELMTGAAGAERVHLIAVAGLLREVKASPMEIKYVSGPVLSHPRLGWVVVVLHQPRIHLIAQVVFRVFSVRWRIYPDQQAALAFLQSADPGLPPLPEIVAEQSSAKRFP